LQNSGNLKFWSKSRPNLSQKSFVCVEIRFFRSKQCKGKHWKVSTVASLAREHLKNDLVFYSWRSYVHYK
jgi:hypothetical protein